MSERDFCRKVGRSMRQTRRKSKLSPFVVSRRMRVKWPLYRAYEYGQVPMSAYQLYQFSHATGNDKDFIKQIFDE